MEQYHALLKEVLGKGKPVYEPRTEEYTLGLGGEQSIYDLEEGFPLMTTKNVPPRLPFEELFWKLRGERNVKGLFDKNIHIWDANAFDKYLANNNLKDKFPKHTEEWEEAFERYKHRLANESGFAETGGDLGPVYGWQWRHWKDYEGGEIDQLENLLSGIKKSPGSRYHLMSAWNVADLKLMALGPCPMTHQFSVWGIPPENLDLRVEQRSCDVFLGVPYNIAQDSLLLHMIANETGLNPEKFIHHYGNVHAYLGVPPRSDFWTDRDNVDEFQRNFNDINFPNDYLGLLNWYLGRTSPETPGNEGKDHIPYILTQLSKSPRELPTIKLKENVSLLDAIEMPAMDYVSVENYNPHKWNSKARMAT